MCTLKFRYRTLNVCSRGFKMNDGFGTALGEDGHAFKRTHSVIRTRVSPSGARGSVIQEPNLDPDVLMVMGSLMPVSLPHAEREKQRDVEHP